jgi:hypothetical protein
VRYPPELFLVCACNKSFDASVDSFHALSCSVIKGSRNLRHDSIRDRFYQLIKRFNPGIQQTYLSLDFEVGQITAPGDNPKHVRIDIKYIKGADIFDAIVDPAATCFLKAPVHSHVNQDGAASSCKHYSRVNTPEPLLARSSIPFIIEAKGRLGPYALLFLHSQCGIQTYTRSLFISENHLICALTAGRPGSRVLRAPMYD